MLILKDKVSYLNYINGIKNQYPDIYQKLTYDFTLNLRKIYSKLLFLKHGKYQKNI